MSVHDLIERARAADLVHLENQEALTRDEVLPAMPELEREIGRIRKGIDVHFRERGKRTRTDAEAVDGDMELARYPIGFCKEICLGVRDKLAVHPKIRELVAKGVVFRSVYIILYGKYFQNALQLGNLYIDAANDTVDPKKPFLEWMPIRDLDYGNLESWDQVVPVVESYFHCRVVPNHVFPLLAPMVPLMGIRENGRIDLLFFQDMFFLQDLGDGMRRYTEWLRSGSEAAARRLGAEDLAMLEREFGANEFDRFPFEFRPCEVDELVAQAEEFVEISRSDEGRPVLMKLTELVYQAVRNFRRRKLISSE